MVKISKIVNFLYAIDALGKVNLPNELCEVLMALFCEGKFRLLEIFPQGISWRNGLSTGKTELRSNRRDSLWMSPP